MTQLHSPSSPDIDSLMADLQAVCPLVRRTVPIPATGIAFTVLAPESIEPLLDDAAHDPEGNLPYWAEIWPSGIALAAEVLLNQNAVSGLPVLELGCGAGITAAAATMAGARLVATDYSPSSLTLTALTCLQAGQPVPALRQVNWRTPEADLLQAGGERWPMVLAADVLYEERDILPVVSVLNRIVAPGGAVWLAEPGRRVARAAVDLVRAAGWHIESRTWPGPWPGASHEAGDVTVHKMTSSAHND